MSTFIATLGFDSQQVHLQSAKSSILAASLISAILGVLYIRLVAAKKQNTPHKSMPKSSFKIFNLKIALVHIQENLVLIHLLHQQQANEPG